MMTERTGLPTRSERVDAGGRTRWFEIDLPDAMALRRRIFADDDRRTLVAASVLDDGGPWLFVAEAVLVYLPESDVRAFVARLAGRFPGSLLALDTWGSSMRDHQDDDDTVGSMEARSQWFCDDLADLSGPGVAVVPLQSLTFADDPQMLADRQNLVRLDPAGAGGAASREPADLLPELRALADLLTPMAVRVAATLRLADAVDAATTAGSRPTVTELAAAVGADVAALDALVRFLVGKDVFTLDGDDLAGLACWPPCWPTVPGCGARWSSSPPPPSGPASSSPPREWATGSGSCPAASSTRCPPVPTSTCWPRSSTTGPTTKPSPSCAGPPTPRARVAGCW